MNSKKTLEIYKVFSKTFIPGLLFDRIQVGEGEFEAAGFEDLRPLWLRAWHRIIRKRMVPLTKKIQFWA